ncbi:MULTISPECIES: protease complex subunit PrcB family protein [Flavobacterium]|uniref:protease complex subunit PrcB family protein n=1 Tax=Flavobacterium TaxID=237 RepID=UPI00188C90ED|nr:MULTISPECIES: protease complex subunit PrcB family protein [Flavobacterium]MBF4473737.1 protease complex subunit PrcB family protein [Flavobacterium sp. HJJ]
MKRFILAALAAFSFYSCTDTMDNGDAQNCGNVRNVAFENFVYCGQLKENPTKPIYVLINSNEELLKQFTFCDPFGPMPDFTQKRILGLLSGSKPSSGYDIKIQSVIENDCEILVEYSEREPKSDEGVLTVITYPSDFVVLPKSNKPILFRKINPINNYIIVGTYFGECTGSDCFQFYKIEAYKVIKYPKAYNFPVQFNQTDYKALVYSDDLAGLYSKIPAEIKSLKGQTKTFGSPDAHDQGGTYLEWSEAGVVTKIYLDNDNTADQTAGIIALKKVIQDKITLLKTKS